SCYTTLSMTEESPDDPLVSGRQSVQLREAQEHVIRRQAEALNNFPLTVYPYHDSDFLEELATFMEKDEADFKRALHAHLLSKADEQGWNMDFLKSAVKTSLGYKDNKDVDKFIQNTYQYANFEQFIKVMEDIAIVDDHNHVFPVFDEITQPLYDDAVASMKNKDDKERKKDATIARNLVDPKSVEEFHRGANRLRKAIIEAVNIHGAKDNSITKIRVMDGTEDIVDGINYNHVLTEYERLYNRKLTDECKKICGRSTLMKGLTKGNGPDCFIDTFAMEVKVEGPERGAYIGIRKNSREYSEAEIQVEVEKYRARRSQVDHKMRKWNDRDNRPAYVPIEKPREEEKAEKQRHMREQLERQTAPQSMAQTANQSVPPSHSPNDTNSSERILDELTRAIPSSTNEKGFEERMNETKKVIPREVDSQADEGEDSDSNQGYSDDENIEEIRKATAKKKKKKEMEKERKRKEQEEGLSDFLSPSTLPSSTKYDRDAMMQIEETAPLHSSSLPLPSWMNQQEEVPYGDLPPAPYSLSFDEGNETIDDLLEADLEKEGDRIPVSHQPMRRGIGQANAWDVPDSSVSPLADPPSIHQSGQQQAADAPPAPWVPCSPLEGQSSQSPSPIGDPLQQVPMQDQYGQPVYPPPPHPHHPQYTGQPGVSPFQSFPLPFDYGAHAPPPGPYPPPPPPPSASLYGPLPPYSSPYPPPEGGHYPPYYAPAPAPPHFYPPPPGGVYPPQQPYLPYGMPPPPPQSVYGQPGLPGGYGYGTGGGHHSPVVNVQVVHGAPPPGSDQFPPSNYQTPSPSPRGSSLYRGVPSDPNGVPPPPADPRYATPFSHHPIPPQRNEMREYGGHVPERRDSPEEAARERLARYPPRHPQREEEYRRRMRSPPLSERSSETEERGFGDASSGVHESGFRRKDRGMGREGGRGFGMREDDDRGGGERRNGQTMRRQTGPSMDDRREREIEGRRREEEPLQGGSTRQGFGQREEEREERGGGRRDLRANGRRDEERRAKEFGQPRGTSTPLNASREEDNMWTSHINKLNSARRRIRWQIVSILKNVRDKNLVKKARGQELQIYLLEIEPLAELIMMGCGNEMEFFEATQELNMSGDNPFFNLLKDMRNDGLCQLLKGKARNRKTGELEDKVYVLDPKTVPHSSFNLTKVGK
ncbi:hypothetical protein PENTCL1PPCAC_26907, partial [Pristionchus entomophagus]